MKVVSCTKLFSNDTILRVCLFLENVFLCSFGWYLCLKYLSPTPRELSDTLSCGISALFTAWCMDRIHYPGFPNEHTKPRLQNKFAMWLFTVLAMLAFPLLIVNHELLALLAVAVLVVKAYRAS